MQLDSLLKQFGIAAADGIVPLIYNGLVDPLLALRAQVNNNWIGLHVIYSCSNIGIAFGSHFSDRAYRL
jgi:hypothetical protein